MSSMTPTKLRPGLDLDILVEIHVLKTPKEAIDKYLRWLNDPARMTYTATPPEEGYHQPRPVSQYIGAAMNLVVQTMRKDWFSFKCWQPSLTASESMGASPEIAIASFICGAGPCPRHKTDFHNHHGAYDVKGETLAHAICLAALQALKAIRLCAKCGAQEASENFAVCPSCYLDLVDA